MNGLAVPALGRYMTNGPGGLQITGAKILSNRFGGSGGSMQRSNNSKSRSRNPSRNMTRNGGGSAQHALAVVYEDQAKLQRFPIQVMQRDRGSNKTLLGTTRQELTPKSLVNTCTENCGTLSYEEGSIPDLPPDI